MKNDKKVKTFVVRLPRDLWLFLRKHSVDIECSMNKIILECMDSYKEKNEKKL